MTSSKVYLVFVLCGAYSMFIFPSDNPSVIDYIKKIELPTIPVSIKFDGLGEELGQAAKGMTKGILGGAMEGFSEAAESGDFGRHATTGLQNITQQGAGAFAKAMGDPKLHQEMEKGASEFASALGAGTKSLNIGLQEQVFPELKQGFQGFVGSFVNLENALRYGSIIGLSIAIPLAATYGSRVMWNIIEKRLLNPKPKILLPGSKIGRLDRIDRWWSGYKTPPMIFDQSVKDRLLEIQEKTKNIRDHIRNGKKTTYDNLMLYGKPGTGKTLFAQILADQTDIDFLPVTAASLLQSGVEGIKYFDELLEMANRSKYGTIIFVDEADALFIDRNTLSPESDHYKVLNHILALTGSGSNKFMLVAATNHAYMMDAAMGRRFQDRVLMPVPDAVTRLALLDLYMGSVLFNEKENGKQFVQIARSLVSQKTMNDIVQRTSGLSHAEIKDMVVAMRKKADATKDGLITQAHVQDAVDQAVEKFKALEEDRRKREQRMVGLSAPV